MRRLPWIATLLALGLLATPLAVADDDEDDSASDRKKERREARDRFADDANRTAAFEAFRAHLQAVRASWLENATAVRAECAAAAANAMPVDDEDDDDDKDREAQCVRDGYRAWRDDNRAELRALHMELRALFAGPRSR